MSPVNSKIYANETVTNTSPRANADETYVVAYIEYNGELFPALFTDSDLQKAMKRAKNNKEDLPPPYVPETIPETQPEEHKSFLARLFGG